MSHPSQFDDLVIFSELPHIHFRTDRRFDDRRVHQRMNNTVLFRVIAAIVILVTTLIGSACTMCVRAAKWTSRLESLAGGVFLGAGLAHLLSDSYEDLSKVDSLKYPLAPAVALVTFIILTLVEFFSYSEHDAQVFTGSDHEGLVDSEVTLDNLATGPNVIPNSVFGREMRMSMAAISLYIIMDIHSTIEGIALGITTSWSGLIAITCAIVGHKPVEAFALALILLKERPVKLWFWVLIALYVICSPVGVVAGIFVEKISNNLVLGMIAAFSAGTFLFVGCHEWSEMFEHKNEWKTAEKWWHFGLFAIGIIWMLLIAIVEMYAD